MTVCLVSTPLGPEDVEIVDDHQENPMVRKLKSIHPGEQLREEFMVPLGLSSNALARALNVTPARINEIVRERRGISADTALRLARFFDTTHHFWLNLQANYDVQCAEDVAGKAIAHIRPLSVVAQEAASARETQLA